MTAEAREDECCDRQVAGSLLAAQRGLKSLLVEESESLVTVLGHVEVALESTVASGQRETVREHCYQVLRIVTRIEQRHREYPLPANVAGCLTELRAEMNQALERLSAP